MQNRQGFASLRNHILLMLLVLLAVPLSFGVAQEQDGPPEHVRQAVDGTIAMIGAEDAGAAENYVDNIMTGVAPDQRSEMIARVDAIRAELGGLHGNINIEGRPGGVTLILAGEEGGRMLYLDITSGGVTRIDLQSGASVPVQAANDRDGRIEQHVRALEQIHSIDWNDFVTDHLSADYRSDLDLGELENLQAQLVNAARNAGGAGLDVQGDAFLLTLSGPDGRWAISFTVEDEAPFAIRTIGIADANADLSLPEITRQNIDEVLAMAEEADLDGVVYVNIDGEEIARSALGFADRALGRQMTTNMIFGTGSQPIDYTVALALIANEQGHLSLDEPISTYVGEVPQDKAEMTVHNLLYNLSGLPDFVDNDTDWDPDLTWITREEFVRRVLEAPLRFTPGERRGHSHAGFSFLAAIVEIATGKPYYDYLREQILDPAGMTQTGMYGDRKEFVVEDFAVGGGDSIVGLPNIPPNWGPTSWLVKGSGGMYSSLDDMLKFTRFLQSSEEMPAAVRATFGGESVNFNGSMRGFELFEYRRGTNTQILVFSNSPSRNKTYRDLTQRLEQFGSREAGRSSP